MAEIVQPPSLSVYRGQARTGQGEGPGKAVLHGEQYLWVDRELFRQAELLDAIRPWMTLDSDPADHQRLNDRLEGWSLFTSGDYLFVVRLVSAGVYDRRAAYFAHGRAWKCDAFPPGFDPGLYLGCDDAFSRPWQDDYPGENVSRIAPSLAWSADAGDAETAARMLGHLLQAMNDGYPLIIAAPVSDFVCRGSLHALVSLARGGLPADLRRECRLRIYSRLPEFFLRHLGANLVVVPEEAAGGALAARPNATLLDRRGATIAGRDLDDRALAYAKAVVGTARHTPQGLPYFSERFGRRFARSREMPSPDDVRAIRITYNLAVALAGTAEDRAAFLSDGLSREVEKLGPGLNWSALIDRGEWDAFPPEAVLDQLLVDADLSPARRGFLRIVEDGAAARSLRVDGRLTGWWDARNPHKVRRLVELIVHDPPLVSEAAAAERTAEISIEHLPQDGPLLAAVLRAEAKCGRLARRSLESASLAAATSAPEVLDVLSRAVSERQLDSSWGRTFVLTASSDRLADAARRWLPDPRFWRAWSNVPNVLLNRLRQLQPAPGGLEEAVRDGEEHLDPVKDLDLYLRLADLRARIRRGRLALPEKLRLALPRLADSPASEKLERIVADRNWECLRLGSLDLESLLDLAAVFQAEETLDALCAELDSRMEEDAEATTNALVASGWWFFWRRRTAFLSHNGTDAEILRRSAVQWLISERRDGEGASLEAWDQALEDLPRTLRGTEIARLCRNGERARRRWPWIPPFEEEQIASLIERAEDLGGLVELAEALESDGWTVSAASIPEYVLSQSPPFVRQVHAAALGWLEDMSHDGMRPLGLEESAFVYRHAGHRRQQALGARIRSVATRLTDAPEAALEAAGDPPLWHDGRFRRSLAGWMCRQQTLDKIGRRNVAEIDRNLDGKQAPGISDAPQALVRQLVAHGYHNAAGLLSAELSEDAQKENLADKVIDALLAGRGGNPCWQQLAAKIKRGRSEEDRASGRHPLMVLAERIRERKLPREQRKRLGESGWETFLAASESNPSLMTTDLHEQEGLPHFHLVAAMLGPGAIGHATIELVLAEANAQLRTDARWWRSILRAMRSFRRHGDAGSAEDRVHVAFALVRDLDLPEVEQAIDRAVKSESMETPQCTLWSELGDIRS